MLVLFFSLLQSAAIFPLLLSELGQREMYYFLKVLAGWFLLQFSCPFLAKTPLRTVVQFICAPCFYTAVPESSQLALPTFCTEQTQLFMQYTEEEREISL